MPGYVTNIERDTLANRDYRRVLFTGRHLQLVLMTLQPGAYTAIVTGVDFHESTWEAALWAMRYFAPGAEHELVHVLDVPELPGPVEAPPAMWFTTAST